MELTTSYDELNLGVSGYMLNGALSKSNQVFISQLQKRFSDTFGDTIYTLPFDSLHITLMDWVAPLVDYMMSKDQLFQKLFSQYDEALTEILDNVQEINIHFDTLKVSNGAIFLVGTDNGQFQAIRNAFVDKVSLVTGTKQPPTIIHTTIARFTKEIELDNVQRFALTEFVSFTQSVKEFRLVNEKKIPMLEYDLVKYYALNK
jgi:hypothetical protein